MHIKDNLIYLTKQNQYSYRHIEKITGVNISSLDRIKKGHEENITILTVKKLADFFGVSLDDFVNKDLMNNLK